MMLNPAELKTIVACLSAGGIIACPTEAVYGLSCDYRQAAAVQALCDLKQRPLEKGLILVGADWDQFADLLPPLDEAIHQTLLASWPGPNTWVVPADKRMPAWIKGEHPSVAIRVTAHPVLQQLCRAFGHPLVSTSANPSTQTPARTAAQARAYFGAQVDHVIDAELGDSSQPTTIRDALTGTVLRP